MQQSLGLSRSPTFVEGVDRNSGGLTQIGRESDRLLRFRAAAAVHVNRETHHRSANPFLRDQLAKRADVAPPPAAVQYSSGKRELLFFVGDRESDSFTAEIDAEYTHETQCSESLADSSARLGRSN